MRVYPGKHSKKRVFIFDQSYMFNPTEWEYINDPTSGEFREQEWIVAMFLVKHMEAMEFHKAFLTKIEFLTALIKAELYQRKLPRF